MNDVEQMPQPIENITNKKLLEYVNNNQLMHLLPGAVYVCDLAGRIVFYNQQALRLWGYRPDLNDPALKYCACYKVFAGGQFISPDKTPMAVALETGTSFRNVEALVERPDGSNFFASVNIDPIFDEQGNRIGAINLFQDITTQKTHALKQSEERYQKMIEEVEDYAILLLDINGIILNWNKGAQRIKGYREEEIIGKSFQQFYLPADRESGLPLQLLKEAHEKGKAVHEGWRLRKDGSKFWGSVVLTAVHDDNNNIIGISKVTRDLTERKLAEDRMKEYLARLEFQNRELEQFVYAASHDMKEPLRKILIYNQYIAEQSSFLLQERSNEYLSRSIKAAERMYRIIEDLLLYSKTTSEVSFHEPVNLYEVIAEIAAFHQDEQEQKNITFNIGPLATIQAVPFQLKQLFTNLISNAIKYRHPERATIVEVQGTMVKQEQMSGIVADADKPYYRISVADNGIGFDQQYAQKIFEVFQRLTNNQQAKGSGIGLAICKKIVTNHHGYIQAIGHPGEGAQFLIYLPVV